MGNKHKSKKRCKKRCYINNQKHMMEVVNKKKRMMEESPSHNSDASEPSSSTSQESKIFTMDSCAGTKDTVPMRKNNSEVAADILVEKCITREILRTGPITEKNNETTDVLVQRSDESNDNTPAVEVEVCPDETQETYIGRRIISISHFYKKLQNISNHGPLGCSLSNIDLVGEKPNGLTSKFTFKCRLCNMKFCIESDSNDDHYLPVNSCAVAGIVSIGGGHSHLQELCSSLNLPLMSNAKYQNVHEILSKNWEELAQETMDHAAEKERNLAIADGRVSKEGIPMIDVCVDGCYSKRSYKKNYSALSGAGAIIGKRTGEILYLGVRNKYCYTCDRAEKNNTTPVKEHKCFKNYTGPSTGMESEIIVEGFKQSIETHNLIYARLISDGDSSTYNKILQAHPYEGITVEKIECRNHLLRNFCNKLQSLQTDTRYPVKHRKILTKGAIMSMRSVIKKSIAKNKKDECPDIQNLFDDIMLSHHHAFDDHTRCKSFFCEKKIGEDHNIPSDFFLSSLWQRICLIVQNIAGHARSLIHDVDSNIVERYHSVIAKYIGGKRVNFSLKQSYATRCKAAAVSFNTNRCLSRLYKKISSYSPQGKLKMLEERRKRHKALNNKYLKKKRRVVYKKRDENYGENCKKPDMPIDVTEKMKESFLTSLKRTEEERKVVERKTILQKDSSEWMELRRTMLTSSNFGRVIKKRQTTPCANTVKHILYKTNLEHVASIKHGLKYEKTAILQLERQKGIKIDPCGLFIDGDLQFLGATPDGLWGDDAIIEIKCPITAYKLGLKKAIEQRKVTFWKKMKDGSLKINKNHSWYLQIQGQLHISKRKKCLFAVWYSERKKLKTEIIKKDNKFWKNMMKEKLESFYMNCLLPEIIDPRFTRNLPLREPGTTDTNNGTHSPSTRSPNSVSPLARTPSTHPPLQTNQQQNQSSCSRCLNFNEF